MVITRLLGNAVVCTSRSGGVPVPGATVACRILHDPTLPPSHHYLATYWYLDRVFGADVIVHVGTHGSLEFLPGKGIALSDRDFPDAVVGTVPFLYLYNSDNPAEGTVAKRRACATLVDHLQTSMVAGGLYGDLQLLNERIGEYLRLKEVEPARAHAAGHLVGELLEKTGLGEEIRREPAFRDADLDGLIPEVQARLARLSATWVPDGMHVFGTIPDGEREAALITAVLRYDGRLRRVLLAMMGLEPTVSDAEVALIELLDRMGVSFVRGVLDGRTRRRRAPRPRGPADVPEPRAPTTSSDDPDIARQLEASGQVGARHRDGRVTSSQALPAWTRQARHPAERRNFYPVDPRLIPSESAWRVGRRPGPPAERHRGSTAPTPRTSRSTGRPRT